MSNNNNTHEVQKSILQRVASGELFAHVQEIDDELVLTYDNPAFGGAEDAIPLIDVVMAMSVQAIIDEESSNGAICWHIDDAGETCVSVFGDIVPLQFVGLNPELVLFDLRKEPNQVDAGRIVDLDSLLNPEA